MEPELRDVLPDAGQAGPAVVLVDALGHPHDVGQAGPAVVLVDALPAVSSPSELPGMQGVLGMDMLPGLQDELPRVQGGLEMDMQPGVPGMQPGLQDDLMQKPRKKWTMEKKWKELTRDGSGNMSLQQVTDRGVQMTTRSLGAGRVRREKGLMIVKMKRVEEDENNDDEEVRISISEDMKKNQDSQADEC